VPTIARQHSAFVQLRTSPRVFVFMSVMLVTSTSIGASAVAKLQFATTLTGSEFGIGALSLVAALGGAVMGLPAGTLVDRFNPRWILLGIIATMVTINGGSALALTFGKPSFALFIALAFVEGLVVAISVPTIAAIQAAMVRTDARGAAEILNLLRLAIGGISGTVLASRIDAPNVTLFICAGLSAMAWPLVWKSTSGVDFARKSTEIIGPGAIMELFTRLRHLPLLRQTVIADLVLRLVIPTQLVNLFIVDKSAQDIAAFVILGGVLGVFAGNISLAVTGLRGRLDLRLRVSFCLYAANIALGSLLMIDDLLLSRTTLLVIIVVIGSALSTYVQGLIAAMIQQRSPDDIRGRLTGGLAGVRMLLVAVGVLLGTVITTVFFTQVFSWTLFALAVAALIALKGFRYVGARV